MKRIASRGKLAADANNNNNNKQTSTPNQITNTANPFKRLWSTGSDKSKDNKMPYPEQIIVGQVDPKIERQIERRREKDEIEYWKAEAEQYKEKATKLEKSIEYFEEKLTLLELQVSNNNNGSITGLDDSTSSPPTLLQQGSPKRSDRDGLSKSLPSNPQSSSPPPSPLKINSQKIISLQRRDEIVLELITEMERVITLRTLPGGDNEDIDIHTSTLEEIVERTLAAGAQDYSNKKKSSKSASSKSNKGGGEGGEKKKHKSSSSSKRRSSNKTYVNELYQLSCKHCVGQNFVGTTKGDLKEKVKDHYGVVWQLVSQAYGKGPKNEDWKNNTSKKKGNKGKGDGKDEEEEEEKQEDFDHVFRASSFSHHIAEHCRECNSESKVLSWCAKNVKVEKIAASANSF